MNKREQLAMRPTMKVLQVETRAVEPDEGHLAQIRPYLLRDFPIEDLYIRKIMLANDQVDRSFERFDVGYLKRFAETIVGKSVLVGHEYGTAPVGRFFAADVEVDERGWNWVAPWFYMPKSDGNALARDSIDSGVWSYASIGASVDYEGLRCDICGRPYYYWLSKADSDERCPHIMGEVYDGQVCTATWDSTMSDMNRVEAVEGSIVYLGCQYEAAVAKSAARVSEMRVMKETLLLRGAVPSHAPETAPEDRDWDADAAISRLRDWATEGEDINWSRYKLGFAWFDEENAETYGAYKLPHHDIMGGNLVTVWAGVAAAGAALMGSRGGVDIPEGDVAGVKAHLARHYEQFDRTPPWESEEESEGKQNEVNDMHGKAEEAVCEHKELAARVAELERECNALKAQAEIGVKLQDRLLANIKRLASCVGDKVTPTVVDYIGDVDKLIEIEARLEEAWAAKNPAAPQSVAVDDETEPAQPIKAGQWII